MFPKKRPLLRVSADVESAMNLMNPGHRTHTPADDPAMSRGLARGGGGGYRASQYKLFLEQYFKYSLFASTPVRRLAGGGRCRCSLSRWWRHPPSNLHRTLVDVLLLAKTDHKCHQVHNY